MASLDSRFTKAEHHYFLNLFITEKNCVDIFINLTDITFISVLLNVIALDILY